MIGAASRGLLCIVLATRPPDPVRSKRQAEAVAFVVTLAVGLDTGTAVSDYIQLYNGDKDTLGASLDRIQKVAATIIEAVTEVTPVS